METDSQTRSSVLRLGLALVLSVTCAAGSLSWYRRSAPRYTPAGQEPLAQVARVGDEVLKRPPTRLLWQALSRGDSLYSGETIRTSARGELRIQFEDGRFIDMEPDSLIVLQKSKGEIALDLLEGSLFVDAVRAAPLQTDLVLKSGSGKVSLNGSSATVAKSAALDGADRLDVQVIRGTAKVRDGSGKARDIVSGKRSSLNSEGAVQDDSEMPLESLLPKPLASLYVDPASPNQIKFTWQGAHPRWRVALWLGPSRAAIQDVASALAGAQPVLSAEVPPGKNWWRLVATDEANKKVAQTALNRIDVLVGVPPTPAAPAPGALFDLKGGTADVDFRWQSSEGSRTTRLTLLSLDESAKPLIETTFDVGEAETTVPKLKPGAYAWVLTAFYAGNAHGFRGQEQRFSVGRPAVGEIAWDLPAGKLGEGQEQSFAVDPALSLAWKAKARKEEIATFSVHVSGDEVKTEVVGAERSALKMPVAKAGRYVASVEGFDRAGALVARSSPQAVTLYEIALLGKPALREPDGERWESVGSGRLDVRWDAVPTARAYRLVLEGSDGQEISRRPTTETRLSLRGILPGRYVVKVLAVDEYGRDGLAATASLRVPNQSNLLPPTLKKPKVE